MGQFKMTCLQYGLLIIFLMILALLNLFLMIYQYIGGRKKTDVLVQSLVFMVFYYELTFHLMAYQKLNQEGNAASLLVDGVQMLGHGFLILTGQVFVLWDFYQEYKRYWNNITEGAIKEAVDSFPRGVCIAEESGLPLLVNRKMLDLSKAIMGQNLANANYFWQKITNFRPVNNVQKAEDAEMPTFILPDKTVWIFLKQELWIDDEKYMETVAIDVTEMYWLSIELEDQNRELAAYQQRLKILLRDIAEIKNKEEILDSKVKLHDELGRNIVATSRYLKEEASLGPRKKVEERNVLLMWQRIIGGFLTSVRQVEERRGSSIEELLKVGRILGCQIVFEGAKDLIGIEDPLLETTIREAMINAVRHGQANELRVFLRKEGDFLIAEISDNAKVKVDRLVEGGGLKNLRARVEQGGGKLKIYCQNGVRLKLELRVEGEVL